MQNGYLFPLGGGSGGGGTGGESTIAWKPSVDADGNISWSRSNSTTAPATQNIKGGPGDPGEKGDNGFSPIVSVTETENGHKVSIEDKNGPKEFEVLDGKDLTVSKSLTTYVSLYDLNTKKELSLEWENNVDNTQKIIDALIGREEFIDSFASNTNRIGIVGNYGSTVNSFHVIKRSSDLAIITATMSSGIVLNRSYSSGVLGDWCSSETITSLTQLGLTADATVDDVVSKLNVGQSALINVAEFTDKTQFPDTSNSANMATLYVRRTVEIGRTVVEWFKKDGRFAVGVLDGNNKVSSWKEYSTQEYVDNKTKNKSMYSYSSLSELGLDTTATINDIIGNMANNSIFVYKTDAFDLSEYENLQYATVTIIKQSPSRVQAFMTDKNTGGLYIPYFLNDGKFGGWISYVSKGSNYLYKVFNNQNGSTAKWYKVTNAPTQDGKSYTVKLYAQRITHTGHIEYVSVSRDSSGVYYTNSIELQEKAGGSNPSEANASYLVVDANNELWLKVAPYAYATIELLTPNTTGSFSIDGSEGTPVETYKYNTFDKR